MGRTVQQVIAEVSPARRGRIERNARRMADEMLAEAASLAMLRKAHDKTQQDLAQALGVKANAITQLEQRSDMLLSTLRKYVRALGADLVLSLRTKDGRTVMLDSLRGLGHAPATSAARKKQPLSGGSKAPRAAPKRMSCR